MWRAAASAPQTGTTAPRVIEVRFLGQWFGHQDVVARNFDGNIGSEWRGACLCVTQMAVKRRKRSARADDAQINSAAAGGTKIILRGVHQKTAQASALPWRIHAEQPQVTTFAPKLHINAPSQARGVFRKQEFPFFHVATDSLSVDAVAFDEGLLHHERRVDETH